MKNRILFLSVVLLCGVVNAAELRVSSNEPVMVTAPDHWTSVRDKSPSGPFPFETFRVEPPTNRNALCLVSILDKNKQTFTDPQFLKKLLRGDSRPYVNSPDELAKMEVKELSIKGGLGYYANFVDPDLVGKPVRKGSYKTATPIILSLGSNYLIKVTVLCDEINGADYQEAIKVIDSIRSHLINAQGVAADLWAADFVARRSQPAGGDAPSSRLVHSPNLLPLQPCPFMRWLLALRNNEV